MPKNAFNESEFEKGMGMNYECTIQKRGAGTLRAVKTCG